MMNLVTPPRPRSDRARSEPVRVAPAAPWYVHPAEDPAAWRRLLSGRNELAFAVVNPANGPGPVDDPYYPQVLAEGSATALLGYVNVDYGRRDPEDVLADVRDWHRRYPVSGVMLDCVPSQVRQASWDLAMIDRVREAGAATVVVNPGTPPAPELVLRADVTCVAEQDWSSFRNWQPPDWLHELPARRQWMLLHDVPIEQQGEAMELIGRRGAGLGWVTAGTMPNPWAVLPAVW